MTRRGSATLPLHDGSAPRWLFDRMVELGGAISEIVIEDYGREEFLRRLADPYWFQALGCVLGFDWHSSGVTTTTMGALKEALDPTRHGVVVAGGKGATSRETPQEIEDAPLGLSGSDRRALKRTSRLSAAVDNGCVQDGHTLYHHTMVLSEDGEWCVVQQGMDDTRARRYHWLSSTLEDLVEEPQNAICSDNRRPSVLDLTASQSAETRAISVDLVQDDPRRLERYLQHPNQLSLAAYGGGSDPGETLEPSGPKAHLRMPAHHELELADLSQRSIDGLQRAYEYQPADYEALVGVEGVGPKSLRALALIAELVHDAESAREDPAKYAYAHGGKDGTPEPVDRERYDRSIAVLRDALEGADVDRETKQDSLERLATLEAAG